MIDEALVPRQLVHQAPGGVVNACQESIQFLVVHHVDDRAALALAPFIYTLFQKNTRSELRVFSRSD